MSLPDSPVVRLNDVLKQDLALDQPEVEVGRQSRVQVRSTPNQNRNLGDRQFIDHVLGQKALNEPSAIDVEIAQAPLLQLLYDVLQAS